MFLEDSALEKLNHDLTKLEKIRAVLSRAMDIASDYLEKDKLLKEQQEQDFKRIQEWAEKIEQEHELEKREPKSEVK